MQDGFQEITLTRIFTVEQLQQLVHNLKNCFK